MSTTSDTYKNMTIAAVIATSVPALSCYAADEVFATESFSAFYSYNMEALINSSPSIEYIEKIQNLIDYNEIILSFAHLDKDLFEIEHPNDLAIETSLSILRKLQNNYIKIGNITPSPDGGVIFEFKNDDVYQLLEINNEGKIMYVLDNGLISSKTYESTEVDKLIFDEFRPYALL